MVTGRSSLDMPGSLGGDEFGDDDGRVIPLNLVTSPDRFVQGFPPFVAASGSHVGHESCPVQAIEFDQIERVRRLAPIFPRAIPTAAREAAGPVNSSRQPRRSASKRSGSGATSQVPRRDTIPGPDGRPSRGPCHSRGVCQVDRVSTRLEARRTTAAPQASPRCRRASSDHAPADAHRDHRRQAEPVILVVQLPRQERQRRQHREPPDSPEVGGNPVPGPSRPAPSPPGSIRVG